MEWYQTVCKIIRSDTVGVSLLERLLDAATGYFAKTVELESRLATARFRPPAEEIEHLTAELQAAHDTLLGELQRFRSHLTTTYGDALRDRGVILDKEFPVAPEAAADWVGEFLKGIYIARRR